MIAKIKYHEKEFTLAITYSALMEVTQSGSKKKLSEAENLEQLKIMFFRCLKDGWLHDSIFNPDQEPFRLSREQSDLIWEENAKLFQDLFEEAFPKTVEEAKRRAKAMQKA